MLGRHEPSSDASASSTPVNPQPLLSPLTASAIFLVLTVERGSEERVREVLTDLEGVQRTVGFRAPEDALNVVAGIGADLWPRLYSGAVPRELRVFKALGGDRHHAPSTPGDLLFHVRAQRLDLCFEFLRVLRDRLGDAVRVVEEVQGFRYFDQRDLLGFVDGTENPVGLAAAQAVWIGDEDLEFAGGSYVAVQKYLHDLAAWRALSAEDQELAVGRTKLENVELDDDVKPTNSHVALNTITDSNGEELQVVRDNMPFGSFASDEFGTYYIAYSKSPRVTELMLERMFIGDPPGNYDRLLDFSTAVSGAQFFVPTIDFLESPPAAPV